MTTGADTERRDSFRLDMTAYIAVATKQHHKTTAIDYFKGLEALALSSEFNNLTTELNLVSDRIKELSARKSIEILQEQINILNKLHFNQTITEWDLDSQTISLSEGGCSLSVDEGNQPQWTGLNVGDHVALAIILTPSFFSLFVFAEVINIHSTELHKRLHFQFNELTEKQKQQLLKHMFQAQTDLNKR